MDYRTLPNELPTNPLPYVQDWLRWAGEDTNLRNPSAMALATADRDGNCSVRMVLLKQIDAAGYGVFYTHYASKKSIDIAERNRGAGVLYWDALGRQLRLEGPILKSSTDESDDYFASRPALSQLNAIVSAQSQAIDAAIELEQRVAKLAAEWQLDLSDPALQTGAGHLPRPAHWGGYRLWFDTVELWAEGRGRFHDRIRFERQLEVRGSTVRPTSAWQAIRLQP